MGVDSKEQSFVRVAIIAVVVLLLLRLMPALWGSALLFIIIGSVVGLFYLAYRYINGNKPEEGGKDEFFTRIKEQMDICRQKADAYLDEAEEINIDHRRLSEQLARSEQSEPEALVRAKKVLAELNAERSLRLAKAEFFEESHRQLREMLQSRQLQQELQKSARKLEQWRQNNHLDVSDIEEMRDRIERDRLQLDTISELTNRATLAPDLDHTEQLREKLKNLYS
jgi:hypothetical protein